MRDLPAQILCTHLTLLRLSRLLEMRIGSDTTTSADCNIEDTSSKRGIIMMNVSREVVTLLWGICVGMYPLYSSEVFAVAHYTCHKPVVGLGQ